MTAENPPQLDAADVPLLMTSEQLRNPAPKNTNVSFLRRTQYIAGSRAADSVKPFLVKSKPRLLEKSKVVVQDDPMYIKKYIQKGFDIAYPESKHVGEEQPNKIAGLAPTKLELSAWESPVHPTNPKLKAVGFFPVLPDLQGFPDPGGFVQFKFDKAPVQAVSGKRDERMDVAILLPSAPEERICQEHATKVALHKTNPKLYPDPGPVPWDYDLFLPKKQASIKNVKSHLKLSNPDRNDDDLYTDEGSENNRCHSYDHVRTYATSSQALNNASKQRDIALTVFDPAKIDPAEDGVLKTKQKAAYYYPVLGKTRLKPERGRTIAQAGLVPTRPKTKEDQVDQIQVVVRDPDAAEVYKRSLHRAAIDPKFSKHMPSPPPAPPLTSPPAAAPADNYETLSEQPPNNGDRGSAINGGDDEDADRMSE